MYLSGARGVNTDYIFGTATRASRTTRSWRRTRRTRCTAVRHLEGHAHVDRQDDRHLIERAQTKATTLGGGTSGIPAIEPMMIDGEMHYVLCMHPFQAYDLRTNTSTGQWLDIQKAAATSEGATARSSRAASGCYNNVVLHKHKGVIRFSDYGAGGNVAAARALFLGRQAGVVAFGSAGNGLRFDWHEESRDNGNQAVITTSSIFGIKKTAFTDRRHLARLRRDLDRRRRGRSGLTLGSTHYHFKPDGNGNNVADVEDKAHVSALTAIDEGRAYENLDAPAPAPVKAKKKR
jgi:hypothetical protein